MMVIVCNSLDEDKLPIFANRENRDLQSEVDKIEIKLEDIVTKIEEHKERTNVMKEHLKNVKIVFYNQGKTRIGKYTTAVQSENQ